MKRSPSPSIVEPIASSGAETALRFLPVKEVVRRTSLSRATVYRLVQAGTFPHPVTLTGARTAWVETEVTAWMQARLSGRHRAVCRVDA
jgi:prophage regulatory protein